MSTVQNGGKLIGEGVYGCAFDPPLACKGKSKIDTTHQVGKITYPFQATLEHHTSQYLSKIPNASNYFILADAPCVPKPRSQQTEKDLSHCQILDRAQLPKLSQIIMPFGGKPLSNIPKDVKHIHLEKLAQHLLEAGTLLAVAGVVHFDLHKGNILLDTRGTARIIDFGMAWSGSGLRLEDTQYIFRKFNPLVRQEPPEVSVMNALLENISLEDAIQKTLSAKTLLVKYSNILRIPLKTIDATLRRFLNTSWSFEKRDWYSFFKLYWHKMDSWAIGSILLELYSDLLYDPEFARIPRLEDVIRHLCWTDPGQRYDCVEALAEFAPNSSLLTQSDVLQWVNQARVERTQLETILSRPVVSVFPGKPIAT